MIAGDQDGFPCRGICKGCGEFDFVVRYRKKHEDIVDWMNNVVQPALAAAHTKHRVLCSSTKCDLKMPMSEGASIGMRVEQ